MQGTHHPDHSRLMAVAICLLATRQERKLMDNLKISYLLGAGASWHACSILNEQGCKMIELAESYFDKPDMDFEVIPGSLDEKEKLIWDIGRFGKISLKYGTIDTYAKKLDLNSNRQELLRLKMSVSLFFSIWQILHDNPIKKRGEIAFDDVDRRYISLMASILRRESDVKNKIVDNVRFVTWNYDLQIESAFKAFGLDFLDWESISKDLIFRVDDNNEQELEVCHLNGYHGFFKVGNIEGNILSDQRSSEVREIVDFIYERLSLQPGSIDFKNHINYAWEKNILANKTRKEALRIFSTTDILIIIGYSFPNFNKEIDKLLFDKLRGRKTKIYFQDPNASLTFLNQLVDKNQCEVICLNDRTDFFFLPYEF